MTQLITIDRATLEQLVVALNEVDQHVDLKRYDTAPNEVLFDAVMAALTSGRAALGNAEPPEWQPIETAPKDGKFLIAVWEGDWDNPKRNCTIYQATGFPSGPVWAMRGSYRTEEGGAYKLAGWMPLPTPLKEQQ